jgi:membrane protease YdiL (CAAX protease family)
VKIQLNNFLILFSAGVVILFSLMNILQADQITVFLLVSLFLFGFLIFTLVSMADPKVVDFLQQRFGNNLISALIPLTGLFIITIGYLTLLNRLTPSDVIISFLYLYIPALLLWYDRQNDQKMNWMNLTSILVVWFFIELSLVPNVSIPQEGGISFFLLIALNSIVYSFLIIRRLDTMGYRLQPNRDDWKYSCIYLGLFISFFVIPIGFLTDFIHQTTEWLPLWQFPIILLGIFLFTGLPEELLFRGLIHNLLATRFKNKSPLLILFFSSIIFGFAHINNNDPPFIYIHMFGNEFPVPWAYIILSSIAGWFYGLAYIRTGSILAPAILHAMVDGWWVYFFNPN